MQQAPPVHPREYSSARALRSAYLGMVVNLLLALIKGVAGVLGNSYALVADAVESASDVIGSVIVAFGARMAGKPADARHPYGHGKFEPLAAAVVAVMLFVAAVGIAIESVKEIMTPHQSPAPFTLVVLVGVIIVKELLFRRIDSVGDQINSTVVKVDAWHHRADAITSAAAFLGISIAVIGGPGYEAADDYAALAAAVVIAVNAVLLLRPAVHELTDTAPDPIIGERIRELALGVKGVVGTHKCHVRKVGFDYFVDLDVLCNPQMTIRDGHEVAHNVGEAIQGALPHITKVLVHVEPWDDFGRRSR